MFFLLFLILILLFWYYGFFDKSFLIGQNRIRFTGLKQSQLKFTNDDVFEQYIKDIGVTSERHFVSFQFIPKMVTEKEEGLDVFWNQSVLGQTGIGYGKLNSNDILFRNKNSTRFFVTIKEIIEQQGKDVSVDTLNVYFRAAIFESLRGEISSSNENITKFKDLESVYEKTHFIDLQ